MRAARLYAPGDIRIETIPEPADPGPGEALVRIEAAGICGSDLHNFHTGVWIARSPSTPGHEFVGTVEAVGADVHGLKPGDRVVADSRVPCGACPACRSNREYLCPSMAFVGEVNDGGFAPLTVQPANRLHKLTNPAAPARHAALAEPLAVALHAVRRVAPRRGDRAIVTGAGAIGALAAFALKMSGVNDIAILDRNESRRDLVAGTLGVVSLDTSHENAPTASICIETTGSSGGLAAGLDRLERGGRMSVVGLYRGDVQLDMNRIVEGGISLMGCAAFDNELPQAVEIVSDLQSTADLIPITTIAIDDLPAQYERLTRGEVAEPKTLVLF